MSNAIVFELFTLGDVEVFRAALNGVALVFGSGGDITSLGGAGLGGLAVMSLMLALTVTLFAGVMRQRIEVSELFVLVVAFGLLFGPKFDVLVTDYEGGGSAIAYNVPLGVAAPAGAMSAVSRTINEKLTQAFSPADGEPVFSNIASPLRLLAGFRSMSAAFSQVSPYLVGNVQSYVQHCLAGSPGFDFGRLKQLRLDGTYGGAGGGDRGGGFIAALLDDIPTSGRMALWFSPDHVRGELIPCGPPRHAVADPAIPGQQHMNARLRSALEHFYAATGDFGELLNRASGSAQRTLAPGAATAAAAQPTIGAAKKIGPTDYERAFAAITAGSAAEARDFAYFVLFDPILSGASHCAGRFGQQNRECLAFAPAVQQWASDGAASGSFFSRIARTGANMLLFLFVVMSPIVALVMLAMGARGFKLAASYLLFGAWSQSWYAGMVLVNFYIVSGIRQELEQSGGIGSLSMSSYPGFLDAVTLKLGVAGDLMAAVPLIMMALLSGSVYGLTSVAQRMSGRDRYDEKIESPSLVNSAPVMAMGSRMSGAMGSSVAQLGSGLEVGSVNFTSGAESLLSRSETETHEIGKSLTDQFSRTMSHIVGNGVTGQKSQQLSTALRAMNSESLESAHTSAYQLGKSLGLNETQSAEFARQVQVGVAANISPPKLIGGLLETFGIKASFDASGRLIATGSNQNALSASETESVSQSWQNINRAASSFSRELSAQSVTSFARTAREEDSLADNRTLGELNQTADRWSQSLNKTGSLRRAAGTGVSLTATQILQHFSDRDNPLARSGLERLEAFDTMAQSAPSVPAHAEYLQAKKTAMSRIRASNIQLGDRRATDALASVMALAESNSTAQHELAAQAMGVDNKIDLGGVPVPGNKTQGAAASAAAAGAALNEARPNIPNAGQIRAAAQGGLAAAAAGSNADEKTLRQWQQRGVPQQQPGQPPAGGLAGSKPVAPIDPARERERLSVTEAVARGFGKGD